MGSGGLRILNGLAELMGDCPELRVKVTGHTDAKGGAAINQPVSQARADAIVAYLVSRGLAPERFSSVGAGATKPLIARQDSAANRINRRVDFSLLD